MRQQGGASTFDGSEARGHSRTHARTHTLTHGFTDAITQCAHWQPGGGGHHSRWAPSRNAAGRGFAAAARPPGSLSSTRSSESDAVTLFTGRGRRSHGRSTRWSVSPAWQHRLEGQAFRVKFKLPGHWNGSRQQATSRPRSPGKP